MNITPDWNRYKATLCRCSSVGVTVDVSRMPLDPQWFKLMQPQMRDALEAMDQLESGAIANPDEDRMVGHYWLRNPGLAPRDDLRQEIRTTREHIETFATDVHAGRIKPPSATRFTDLVLVGIGGSALGPQLVTDALGAVPGRRDRMTVHFLDNTDPDGFSRLAARLRRKLKSTMVLVISKSGSTPETRNGMRFLETLYAENGHEFAGHAVAVTGEGSALDRQADSGRWLRRFPMWDWVGGRTSLMSAVGLVPMALQGLDAAALLDGAARMDEYTRLEAVKRNPAAMLALLWHASTSGPQNLSDMVVLPYKDRLLLLSRYLQQLIMESLGKEFDLDGRKINAGIAVYGNKGSTDQHAYVQQLRDGLHNFFVTFIVVLQDAVGRSRGPQVQVDPGITSGDYLNGFWQGTREALSEKGRGSITITLDRLDARSLGAIIALYERAVGLYASLIHINAYHQPGVEAGKKAAANVLEVQNNVLSHLRGARGPARVEDIAAAIGAADRVETVWHVLQHLAANRREVAKQRGGFVWRC